MSSTAIASRTSLDNAESDRQLDAANRIIESFKNASLHIIEAQSLFQHKVNELHDYDPSVNKHPSDIANDVAAQLSFFRKLKFHHLEQNAKDKYVKTIVNDDAQLATAEDNEALRRTNEAKKAKLKHAKDQLAAKYEDIKRLAPQVEQEHTKAKLLTNEAATLTQQILDARLAISRLRTAHPHPRLTIPNAHAELDSQTEVMAALDAQLSDVNTRVEEVKNAVQEGAREVERLRIERAKQEKEVRESKAEDEDDRVVGLYDWFTASLALHRSLFSLHSTKTISENELALTYHISPHSPASVKVMSVTITVLFHPNTRRLADAHLSSADPRISNIDVRDVVGSHVQSNDLPGLIRALQARLRASR